MRARLVGAAVATVVACAGLAQGQYIMMPDSTNNRVVLFDPFSGGLVNSNYFATQGGTTVHAMQVGNEIWISEQIGDRVSRWSLTGSYLGAITGGLDNIRGMGLARDTVYVTNAGTANGAPGAAVVMYNTSGGSLGSFNTTSTAPSPFGVLYHQGDLLVSSSSANDDIHRYMLDGSSVGTFHNTTLSFFEQMDHDVTGNVLAAVFSSNVVAVLNANTGATISTFAASGARGVYQLGNGNIMWTNSAGAWVYDVNAGTSTLVYSGGGRYLDDLIIPTPGGLAVLALSGLCAIRRRR
ncbi:MAG: hypothetical protein KJZ65_08925 [Phycisphaerales bacterium]|nr:hypothetical protein [Phycisphaerales bacterium]